MTVGPAQGHGITVDQIGLEQCLAACRARGSVKLIDRHDGEFEDIVGAITNFRIEGDQVKGDAELFENHPMRARILEIAQKIPSEFGLSIESIGNHEDDPNKKDHQFFRCDDVDAIALVPRPAANKGLFSAKQVDTRATANPENMDKTKLSTAIKAIFTKFAEGDPQVETVAEQIAEAVVEAVEPAIEEAVAEATGPIDARMKKLEDGAEPDPEKEKLEEEKKEEERLSRIVEAQMTKFASKIGLSKVPSSAISTDDHGKKGFTKFSAKVEELAKSGTRDPFTTAMMRHPDLYNEYRAAQEKLQLTK